MFRNKLSKIVINAVKGVHQRYEGVESRFIRREKIKKKSRSSSELELVWG